MKTRTPHAAYGLPLLLFGVGCALGTPDTPAPDPPVAVVQPAPPATSTPPVAKTAPPPPKTPAPPVAPTAKPPQPVSKTPQPVGKTPQPADKAPQPAVQARVPAAAPLDLDSMKAQLRATKAIGVFTKITLKNQVDDLLDRFRDHYSGKTKVAMTDLRRSYDLLMMKVLSLLQDDDQTLASAIVSSREAIWALLADPKKFAALNA